MEIRVPSRRSLFRSLNLLLPLCNEDTGPVTPSSDISGCDRNLYQPFLKSHSESGIQHLRTICPIQSWYKPILLNHHSNFSRILCFSDIHHENYLHFHPVIQTYLYRLTLLSTHFQRLYLSPLNHENHQIWNRLCQYCLAIDQPG
ncbi:hypothetical protein HanHA300_Chr14g0510021 [Helianthus annuus]|nr:hypothetical protein HanHA300_Chr14g0510021 [Helianthus annuus]KAJ0466757.1 hypothetical protein HanIR_Chr14g0675751 [Helianthus annuus]KAJ0484328.1 hypothetical protein HanHA89_Chr14g0542931 [Helianthus annuus]KAJ0654881.1 hypothetical protein HanLR1_Chr14g0512171 [Helianthus annuus]